MRKLMDGAGRLEKENQRIKEEGEMTIKRETVKFAKEIRSVEESKEQMEKEHKL